MNTVSAPIITTTTLSIIMHSVVAVAVLVMYSQTRPNQAVGQGLEIELVSSVIASEQDETDVPHQRRVTQRNNISSNVSNEAPEKKNEQSRHEVLASHNSETTFVADEFEVSQEDSRLMQGVNEGDGKEPIMQSTDASHQRHSILELLHDRISSNKKYPYLAQRQRREGITTVAFVLHPDGTIENTRLINSSQAAALDRAALSAVRDSEPFVVAKDYLDQSAEFQIDIVFDLL